MTAAALLARLRARGVELVPAGDRIRYRPRDALSPARREALGAMKAEVLELLSEAIAWRAAAMRRQVPRDGAFLLLLARPDAHPLGTCCSCGDRLAGGARYRCAPCVAAAVAVLAEHR